MVSMNRLLFQQLRRFLGLASVLVLSGCGGSNAPSTTVLKGGGATLPYPVYAKWFSDYQKERPQVQIDYQASGSGAGVEGLLEGELDFAASDTPLSDEQLTRFKVKPLHFPTLVGAIVPAYNLGKGYSGLKFSGDVLAQIFSGKIKNWSDSALVRLNPDANLPSKPIVVIHRSDPSGTTAVFTHYLSQVSDTWKKQVGEGTTVHWPASQAAQGSEGVADLVSKTEGSIGYLELNYAKKHNLAFGSVRNRAGEFQSANFETVGGAIDSIQDLPKDFRILMTNAPGEKAYPIATMTYLLVPSQIPDVQKREAIKRLLHWIYTTGQKVALDFDYDLLTPAMLNPVSDQAADIH